MGKWKMDYSACEGYDEFMAAEVVLPLLLLNIIIDLKSEEEKNKLKRSYSLNIIIEWFGPIRELLRNKRIHISGNSS